MLYFLILLWFPAERLSWAHKSKQWAEVSSSGNGATSATKRWWL